MNDIYNEMKIEFESAIASVTVEKGLSNLEAFKKRYEEAFEQIAPIPRIVFGNKKLGKNIIKLSCFESGVSVRR